MLDNSKKNSNEWLDNNFLKNNMRPRVYIYVPKLKFVICYDTLFGKHLNIF